MEFCSKNKNHREGSSCSKNNNCKYPECINDIKYLQDKTKNQLDDIATFHCEDIIANEAMKILKEKYDNTYFFCGDCDYLVVKEKDCCLNYDLTDENE